jgi:hypothetical protein
VVQTLTQTKYTWLPASTGGNVRVRERLIQRTNKIGCKTEFRRAKQDVLDRSLANRKLSELTADGPLRFSRLLERVEGVSQKSLTAILRGRERDGLVRRTVKVQVPIRVDYEATPLGTQTYR